MGFNPLNLLWRQRVCQEAHQLQVQVFDGVEASHQPAGVSECWRSTTLQFIYCFLPCFSELTLPQFYSFLHEMERAKASMECFS